MNYDDFGGSDQEAEPDAYLARVKAEAQERDDDNQDSEDESTDEDFNPNQVNFYLKIFLLTILIITSHKN